MTPEVAPVRRGEELNLESLAGYLRGKIEGAEDGVAIEQFPGGHSNLTYLLHAGQRDYVLRRPPLGPVAPKAHDMAREYTVLRAVHPFFPPAPQVFLVCEDPAVVGATFFVMERRHGVVLRRELPAPFRDDRDLPARLSEAFIDCLADLHAVDILHHGLASLGKPEGFLERQVKGWAERWARARTTDLPQMEKLIGWLIERMPASGPSTLVHNDFKLDNLMFDSDCRRVEAVLDWEMATVGDPLVDLGLTLCYWPEAGDPELRREAISGLTAQPGWYRRAQIVERYARRTGRDVSRIAYYEIFALFKVAVVLQQIYFRFWRGQTKDERFRDFDVRVRGLVDAAAEMIEGAAG